MIRYKTLFPITVLLLISNALFAILLLNKKPSAQKVILVLDSKEAGYSEVKQITNSSFWNNFPFLVVTSEGKMLDTSAVIFNGKKSAIMALSGNMIYRYFPNGSDFKNDSIIDLIKRHKNIYFLTDSLSWRDLTDKEDTLNDRIFALSKELKINSEKAKRSYFFILSKEGKVYNIYFPRNEVPEMTSKYIERNKERASFF